MKNRDTRVSLGVISLNQFTILNYRFMVLLVWRFSRPGIAELAIGHSTLNILQVYLRALRDKAGGKSRSAMPRRFVKMYCIATMESSVSSNSRTAPRYSAELAQGLTSQDCVPRLGNGLLSSGAV